jgi:hypothetical protein
LGWSKAGSAMRENHGMAAPTGTNRRYENRLALNFFYVHAAILPETVENQKPTGGF